MQPDVGFGEKVWRSENALASIWLGTNDVAGSFGSHPDYEPFAEVLMDDYFELVEDLVRLSRSFSMSRWSGN